MRASSAGQPLRAGEGGVGVAVVAKSRHPVGGPVRPQGHHQVVTGQGPLAYRQGPGRGVDVGHVTDHHLDASSLQTLQGAGDLLRSAGPGHHPQVGRGVGEVRVPVDQDHPVAAVQAATQPVGGGHPADSATGHQNRLPGHGGHQNTSTLSAARVQSVSSSIVDRAAPWDEHGLGEAPCVHAGAAAPDLPAVAGDHGQHLVEVVVAVGGLLPGHGHRDTVTHEEDPKAHAVTFGHRRGEAYRVVGGVLTVGGTVDDHQNVHEFVKSFWLGLVWECGRRSQRRYSVSPSRSSRRHSRLPGMAWLGWQATAAS